MENNRKTILIVDDEETLTWSISKNLSIGKKYKVICASNTEEALEILKQTKNINLIVSDIRLGGKTGFDLLDEVKANYPDIAFIVMTAYGSSESRKEALTKGALHYIEKPFMMDRIIRLITDVLEKRDERPPAESMPEAALACQPAISVMPASFKERLAVPKSLSPAWENPETVSAVEACIAQFQPFLELKVCTLDGKVICRAGDNHTSQAEDMDGEPAPAKALDGIGRGCHQLNLGRLQSIIVLSKKQHLALFLMPDLPVFLYGSVESGVPVGRLCLLMEQCLYSIKPLLAKKRE